MVRSQFMDNVVLVASDENDARRVKLPGITLTVPALVSLVGAGGKTTTLFRLAEAFKQQGYCVLVTTTTQMFLPEATQYDQLVVESHPQKLLRALRSRKTTASITYCCHAYLPSENKVSGLQPKLLDALKLSSPFHLILVEADGAKCLPLKAPAAHEPCIPLSSDWVVAITGAEMVNVPAEPSQIHRWPLFADLTHIQANEDLNAACFSRFINHPNGMFKQAPRTAIRSWLINKITDEGSSLLPFAQQVLTHCPTLSFIWLSAMQQRATIAQCVVNLKSALIL